MLRREACLCGTNLQTIPLCLPCSSHQNTLEYFAGVLAMQALLGLQVDAGSRRSRPLLWQLQHSGA